MANWPVTEVLIIHIFLCILLQHADGLPRTEYSIQYYLLILYDFLVQYFLLCVHFLNIFVFLFVFHRCLHLEWNSVGNSKVFLQWYLLFSLVQRERESSLTLLFWLRNGYYISRLMWDSSQSCIGLVYKYKGFLTSIVSVLLTRFRRISRQFKRLAAGHFFYSWRPVLYWSFGH